MVGENIRDLRIKKGLTQKDLADKLFVTPQAVSRWEKNEVEPSISAITEMAKIFGVQSDQILGTALPPKVTPEIKVQTKYVYDTPLKPVLGVCERCNTPIYEADNLVRHNHHSRLDHSSHIYCKKCDNAMKEEKAAMYKAGSKKRRIKAYIWGGIFLAAAIAIGIATKNAIYGVIAGVVGFTLISCCILNNNFIGNMCISIFSWGFVKMPGLIFSLDLDGIFWLLTVKLLFWILGFILAAATAVLAIVIGGVMSVFVYPFALARSYKHPEKTEIVF